MHDGTLEEINDVYREYIERTMSERSLTHKQVCKEADISYSHSRDILKGRSNSSDQTLYKLVSTFFSRKEALDTLKSRIGSTYKAGESIEEKDAKSVNLDLRGFREVYLLSKLIALETFKVEEVKSTLGHQYDSIIEEFGDLNLCRVEGDMVVANAEWVEIRDSATIREMARMIASLTNPEKEYNVQQAWVSGLNDGGLRKAKAAIARFLAEILEIFKDPENSGKNVFSIALNSTIL